jgi:energy-coupling factor transporter transmembrane protein EcfT
VVFQIAYTTTRIIMVEEIISPEPKPYISDIISNIKTSKPNFNKTSKSSSKEPPQEPFSFFGCLFNLIGIIIALFIIIMVLFLFIKIWKAALILLLIFGLIWVFSYFGSNIFKALKYLFFGIIILLLISVLFAALSTNTHKPRPDIDDTEFIVEDDNIPVWKTSEEIIESDTLKKDTLEVTDKISFQTLEWKDYNNNYHSFKYKISKRAYNNAKNNRAGFVSYKNDWGQIYYNLYSNDYNDLKSFINKYDTLKSSLSRKEFAELIVSSIQYQPYVWILDVSCNNENYKYKINQSGCSCLGYISRYAVQSPYEYITNQKGDCDTRSLILYTILKHYKYDVVLLTSDYYEHAIIGINIPSYGKCKTYRGKKYYVWETTAKDMRIGQLNASVSNMNLWKVTL